ncbi:MAG: penicillin-binding protein 2 [Termitinemataceae bacterium]|nr:MAG: penicillin-binding protein 2 [Termitinemataceae bacterium]
MSLFFNNVSHDDFNTASEKSENRILLLQILFIAVFVIYSIKLFSMQILQGDVYRSRADDIAKRTSVIPSQRGEIFDRSYSSPIVFNTDSFAVHISPAEIKRTEIDDVINRVAEFLNIPYDQIIKKLPAGYYSLYQPQEIASNIPYKTIAAIAENIDTLPGITWQSKPVRNYRETGSLSHVVGYVGNITRDELTTLYNAGYQPQDVIGKDGIEKQYDNLLRGKDGVETRIVDVRGRAAAGREIVRTPPEMGKNIVLTIDKKIQTLAEKALGQRVGSVIVMRPNSGDILAMVSYPWYDPNVFNQNDVTQGYQALRDNVNKPLINRAIQSSYPPGSTFKVVLTTGIIAESAYPQDKKIECPGEIYYGDRYWRCHIRKPGHGWVNLRRGLAQSCDIYYWVVGRESLGIERIISYAKDFGFGERSGIDLPGEISGFIPTPQWKDRRFHERWQGGDTMNMSIGQGFTLATPIQLANMVAMVVNDGVIYKPHLLKEVRNAKSGEVEKITQREVLHKSEIKKEVFQTVRDDMRAVISEGTAIFPLNIKSVEIAGKTGTSEVGLADRWHSWFAAFAPYQTDNPSDQIVVSIIVEASNKWEWWSPYASAVIYQGIFADQTFEEAVAALHLQYLFNVRPQDESVSTPARMD